MTHKVLSLFALAFFSLSLSAQTVREVRMPEEVPSPPLNIAEKETGVWCAVEVGGGATLMENRKNVAIVGATAVVGYRFNQYLKIGAGLGAVYYPNSENARRKDGHLGMPLFVQARGNILSDETRRFVPFWNVTIGSCLPDGAFFTPGLGLRFGEKRSAFTLSVHYTARTLKSYPGVGDSWSGALLKLGYEF